MKCEEIEISVPWGCVAARLYGNSTNQPVLVVHGIMDNLGSFERLLNLLPETFFYVAIDLPGHGRSSHWPKGAIYNTLDNLIVYKAVINYFSGRKFILMGHSYGGQLSYIFTQLYPELILKLIMIDTLYLFPHTTSVLKDRLRTTHEAYFQMIEKLEKNNPPEYTYEEALDRIMRNRRYGEISQEAAEPVLKRMMVPTENGKLRFTLDQRLKFMFNPTMDLRYASDFIRKSPVLCPTLIIIASESEAQMVYFKKIYQLFKSYRNIKIKAVKGNHDVHNVAPERIAPFITKILNDDRSKL